MIPRHLGLSLLLPIASAAAVAQAPFRQSRNLVLPPIGAGYSVCAGDVDGDGDQDLIVANDHDPNQLLLNDGRGRFTDATAGRLTTPGPMPGQPFGNATYAVDLADVDGDGDLDLLLANDHDLPNRVHVNNGAGVFTDVSATALPPNAQWSVDQLVADLDGDGDVDWFVQNDGAAQLYLNDGAGVFTDVTATHLPANAPTRSYAQTGCHAADLDQDGDLDLVVPVNLWGAGPPVLLINQGAAAFVVAPAGTIPATMVGHTFAVDFDRDGRMDLVTGNGQFLLRNLGGLAFAAPVPLPGRTATAIDYDEDGDVDLLAPSRVYRNDGAAGFALLGAGQLLISPGRHCLADLDGDRDLDVVSPTRIAVNFLRQLHAPAPPTRGQTYVVEYHCPTDSPLVPVLAAISTAAAAIPVPGLGILRLDPMTAVMRPPLFVTGGAGQLGLAIPNAPGLLGLELDCQSLVIDPLRPAVLGNAVQEFVQ